MNWKWLKKFLRLVVQLLDFTKKGTRKLLIFALVALIMAGLGPSIWLMSGLMFGYIIWHVLEAYVVRSLPERRTSFVEAIFGIASLIMIQFGVATNPLSIIVLAIVASRMGHSAGLITGKADRQRLEELERMLALEEISSDRVDQMIGHVTELTRQLITDKKTLEAFKRALEDKAEAERAVEAAAAKMGDAAVELRRSNPRVTALMDKLRVGAAEAELEAELESSKNDDKKVVTLSATTDKAENS